MPQLGVPVVSTTASIFQVARNSIFRNTSCWFRSLRDTIAKEDLRLEVDGFGVAAYHTGRHDDDWWVANFPLPRGLTAGWRHARLRFADSDFSRAVRIAVDLPLNVGRIVCHGVRDASSGYLSCWVTGLPERGG